MKLETQILSVDFEHPVMNAAGTCKNLEGDHNVRELSRSAASAIVVGSITWNERPGNTGNVYCFDTERGFSLNSLGLPNRGAEYYRQNLPEMVRVAHDAGKPLIVSVAGFTPEEYADLCEIAFLAWVDLIEVNLGCPNVWANGQQKRIVSFAPEMVGEILSKIQGKVGPHASVGIKVSPFSDPWALREIAAIVAKSPLVKFVTTTNTFPNAWAFNPDSRINEPTITVGFAGFAGPAMKAIGLGQVKQWREALPKEIRVIGVGGVASCQDVLDYRKAGADAVQVATAFLQEGPKVFSRILTELTEIES